MVPKPKTGTSKETMRKRPYLQSQILVLHKKQYCYKIHTSLMEGSAPPSIDNPLHELHPHPPNFTRKS